MALDITPRSFWAFPSVRWFNWDEEEDALTAAAPTGLSVSEDEKNVYVKAALPGVDPNNIEITFDKGMLWIKGETQEEENDKNKKFYRRATNSFSYRVAVPGEIDLNRDPEATCKNGVMTVSFAKSPQSQPKKIAVKSEAARTEKIGTEKK